MGGLEISFDNDTAVITFHVKMPDAFGDGNGHAVTAAVQARIGPTEPFHITYGYFGALQGGASVDLGPVALTGFGLCYRERYNADPKIDPCQGITGIDDSGLGDDVWMGVGALNIGGLVDVEFRPGANTIKGCLPSPLGFAFSPDGGLSYAGAAIDLSDSGGIPIFPWVTLTGLAAGFETTDTYNKYAGCVALRVVDLLQITGNVFGVHTAPGHSYQFDGSRARTGRAATDRRELPVHQPRRLRRERRRLADAAGAARLPGRRRLRALRRRSGGDLLRRGYRSRLPPRQLRGPARNRARIQGRAQGSDRPRTRLPL